MNKALQAVRGMNDILPAESCYWSFLEANFRSIVTGYGYQEIRLPLVESTDLFKRSIGEVTDIVEKEMYTFMDRNGDSLTLRPEGTAGCVRAGIEHGLLYHQIQRLWYMGPMFRHERPQKGRYRQFHQLGVEAFGLSGAEVDAEIILLSQRFLQSLGLGEHVTLQLNTLGTSESRARYRSELVRYLEAHRNQLDEDSVRRLQTNPLRVLDSKNPAMHEVIASAPKLFDYLDDLSEQHFTRLLKILDAAQIRYEINPRLVRGLDYYCFTVFEWVTNHLGAQGTVCAGGRYDRLVETLGGAETPGVGFACGLERLVLLLQNVRHCQRSPDVFVILVGEAALCEGLLICEKLRDRLPHLMIEANLTGASLKSQLKRADKSGAATVLMITENELSQGKIEVKQLRAEVFQKHVSLDDLIVFLQEE